MFSYQHRYHAGSFADVHKHLVLIAIIQSLQKKDAPLAVLDLHAGEGIYNLHSAETQKIGEYQQGILPIWNSNPNNPLIQDYLKIIRKYNEQELTIYPGSPGIIASLLRPNDRGILVENHPQAILELKKNAAHLPQCQIHARDSYEALKALLPFKEKRGVVLIDPSYEVKTEYQAIAQAVIQAHSRFSNGVFIIWYPILAKPLHFALVDSLKAQGFKNFWQHEWIPDNNKAEGMVGSGIMVINMPWQCDVLIEQSIPFFGA